MPNESFYVSAHAHGQHINAKLFIMVLSIVTVKLSDIYTISMIKVKQKPRTLDCGFICSRP